MEQLFKYKNSQVRTLMIDNTVWFAGIDIASILEYVNPSHAVRKLDEEDRRLTALTEQSGQKRKTWIVNESWLYSLILTSSKPEAKAFKRWITAEVLPAIRKAGLYATEPEMQMHAEIQALTKGIQDKETRLSDLRTRVRDLDTEIKSDRLTLEKLILSNPNQLSFPFPAQ